jgi:RNA polymerase sigma-70 factor (ECF subfamily)
MQLVEEEDILTLEPLEEQTVGQLVLAAQDGDRDAFGELVRRFEQAVLAIALRRLKNYAEAQELSQEVFVQALRKLDQLREPECFGGWLRSITVRLAINRMVRRQPERGTEPETLAATCVETKTPLTEALASERRRQVRDSLDRLRKLDRETLVAFYVEGQTLIEMSSAFDSPIGTIKRRLHVARKRLARELESLAVA